MSAVISGELRFRFYFTERDAEILRRLVEYRFLQPGDFQKLTDRNIISLRRRLRELVEREYLERQPDPRCHVDDRDIFSAAERDTNLR